MDLTLPPMPFSAVFVPDSGVTALWIPEEMRNAGIGAPYNYLELPVGVVQVILTWKGVDPLVLRHYTYNGTGTTFERIATIPASSTVKDRSTGVLTLASDKRHGLLVLHGSGANWNADTLSKGYVAGIQVMPMGTAADITGGGSLLRVDNSVGTRVFLGDYMIHGDTGWRDISDDYAPYGWDWSGHGRYGAFIRREGFTVHFKLMGEYTSVNDPKLAIGPNLPRGFYPDGPAAKRYMHLGHAFPIGQAPIIVTTLSNGAQLQWSGAIPSAGRQTHVILSWTADESWPTSLPGTSIA